MEERLLITGQSWKDPIYAETPVYMQKNICSSTIEPEKIQFL